MGSTVSLRRRARTPRRPWLGLGLAVGCVLLVGCGQGGGGDRPRARGAGPVPVTTTTVASADLVYLIEGTGSLEAYQVVTVAARGDGVVEALGFEEGDAVDPTRELAVVERARRALERTEAEKAVARAEAAAPSAAAAVPRAEAAKARAVAAVERAEAQRRAAATDLAEAEAMLARREEVRKTSPGAVSEEEVATIRATAARRRDVLAVAAAAAREAEAEVEEAEAARRVAVAGVAEAEAAVAEAKARLDTARKVAEDTGLHSPVPGVVRRRHVTVGQYVRAGDAVAEIVDRSRLRVRFRVSEGESARLETGMAVTFRVPALDGVERPATLIHVDETASAVTRMVECLAEVASPAPALKPGFYATVAVRTRVARAVAVPEAALYPTEKGWVAWVVEDGKARGRRVTPGQRTADGRVEVAEGLKDGDTLVVKGGLVLTEGATVAPAKGAGPAADGSGAGPAAAPTAPPAPGGAGR